VLPSYEVNSTSIALYFFVIQRIIWPLRLSFLCGRVEEFRMRVVNSGANSNRSSMDDNRFFFVIPLPSKHLIRQHLENYRRSQSALSMNKIKIKQRTSEKIQHFIHLFGLVHILTRVTDFDLSRDFLVNVAFVSCIVYFEKVAIRI